MSANNKRRAANSPATSQPRPRVHVKTHRRSGSGSSRSSGQSHTSTLPGIPETGLVHQHFFGDSAGIDYMCNYDTDNCASASEHNDTSIHDGSSALDNEAADEVFKYFGGEKGFSWNSKCTEWKICHEENTDVQTLITDTITEIRENPRQSIIATMGLQSIRKGIIINQTNEARWSGNAAAYAAKAEECILSEESLKPAFDEAYNNLKKVNDDYHHLQLKMGTHQDSRRNFEEHCKKYGRRSRIANVIVGVMKAFTADSPDIKVSVCVYCHLLDNQFAFVACFARVG